MGNALRQCVFPRYSPGRVNCGVIECSASLSLPLRVDGGVSSNDFVMQLTANLFGRKVARPQHIEMSCLGAAFVAGLGTGRPEIQNPFCVSVILCAIFMSRFITRILEDQGRAEEAELHRQGVSASESPRGGSPLLGCRICARLPELGEGSASLHELVRQDVINPGRLRRHLRVDGSVSNKPNKTKPKNANLVQQNKHKMQSPKVCHIHVASVFLTAILSC